VRFHADPDPEHWLQVLKKRHIFCTIGSILATRHGFQAKAEELEEEYTQYTGKNNNNNNKAILSKLIMENPFDVADNDVEELADLSLAARVRVLRMITDYRLGADDIPERLKAGGCIFGGPDIQAFHLKAFHSRAVRHPLFQIRIDNSRKDPDPGG
jgi:hypothetical protein